MPEDNELLSILEAHGQSFLNSFSLPQNKGKKRKREAVIEYPDPRKAARAEGLAEDEEISEEWLGFDTEPRGDVDSDGSPSSGEHESIQEDGYSVETPTRMPAVVVFSETQPGSSSVIQSRKVQGKAFMSSKVSKLRQVAEHVDELEDPSDEETIERSNTQNDALLHRLVHTQLLSGSLNPSLGLTSAQRKKALAGRVVELAGGAQLGKGEKLVRAKERNKAAKRVRDGMLEKQAERQEKQISEAKNMGNYHPTIKKLFEDSSEPSSSRKREKGMRMGVALQEEAGEVVVVEEGAEVLAEDEVG
ncbi:hypothetical protein EW146_g2943 [Bondarzewia mesenterica]|uniref:Uncharacterized protein n=1 Tax=Bondarzewia mesenterica TaxID=1095465 RepID=A0A4S4M0K8_9AGAM|nr:hypothetical protein EW146_g2943 [Bondarzewia mesenterica]